MREVSNKMVFLELRLIPDVPTFGVTLFEDYAFERGAGYRE